MEWKEMAEVATGGSSIEINEIRDCHQSSSNLVLLQIVDILPRYLSQKEV